ncbi:MAG: hypothetical protein A3I29_03245 [Candidatus Magasanikbacteria bacterium RIFCSPLOWO2_02_FULL_44_11]|uniref:BioF2-like acetyltransferase domain-containing protein n=2 Tax=Candidatus Magasanikiibacteriota TaxID=1752731 RepID=A0A1F6NBV0_9BACT|nr:MAG: hypothetical protein A3D53_03175 [Candidatus Magasanikbacteria bacterium RIFCSPHIGHO2_02_FULL_45_10]OGH81405.1 MAG: hypothetical protein A3I29_03245 [Candidatus Magasanikbacteria bacterium RIFCSPLOWO2_02_FULL_44_11]
MNQTLRFEIIKDLAAAQKIWESLSPHETIYDDWDFRNTFHAYHKKELFFIVGYQDTEAAGLLALQYNNDQNYFEFWGGSYMEDNRVMVKPGYENLIPEFYNFGGTLGKPLRLEYIRGNDAYTTSLPFQDYKFVLPLKNFSDTNDYLDAVFSGESKKKLVKRLKKIDDLGVTIEEDNWADLELLINWNIAAFSDSAFIDRPFHKEIFRDLLKPHATFQARLLTFNIGGKKQAVTMGLVYNKTYASVNRGIDPEADKNVREYIHVKKVADALKLGGELFDAFVGDYGWKERWGCQKIPQHSFITSSTERV